MRDSKRILILGAGGAPGIGLTRCLQAHHEVYGRDDSDFARHLMLCPPDDGGIYDLIIPAHSDLMLPHTGNGWVPDTDTVLLCADKAKTAEALGNLAPQTHWVRDVEGSGGKGAQMCSEYLPGANYAVEMFFDCCGSEYFQKERVSYKTGA